MTKVNQLTKQKYVQSGGFLMIIAKIGEVLAIIIMALLNFIKALFKSLFWIRFDKKSPFTLFLTLDSGEGIFYKYIWFAVKCGFYLVVFAFGGPLLALVGILFLYKNLFGKLKEINKEEEEEGEESAEGAEGAEAAE
jgi:hypothetical protein